MKTLVAALFLLSTAAVQAQPNDGDFARDYMKHGHDWHSNAGAPASPAAAPELDPGTALGAVVLVLGGAAILRGRRSNPAK